jgi:serine/threonine protein kinase
MEKVAIYDDHHPSPMSGGSRGKGILNRGFF